MNPFALCGLLIGISFTATAGFVYFSNRSARVNRLWAIFCLSVSMWGLGGLLIGQAQDPETALIAWRIAHVGVILIPALFYHFIVSLTEVRRPKTIMAAYAGAAVFSALNPTPLYISQVRWVFSQFYYLSPATPLYTAFVGYFFALIVLSHLELWRSLRVARTPQQRILAQWLITGTALGFAGGGTCFLPVFGVDLYPWGNYALPCFPLFMTYAFLRYRLIDLNLAVARGAAFFLTYVAAVGLPFYVGARYQALWRAIFADWWWAVPVALMGLLASVSQAVLLSLSRRLEQRAWQTQRSYHRTLITASGGMVRIKDIRQLCALIARMVNRSVRLTNSLVFLYNPKEQRYELQAARYPSQIPPDLTVSQEAPLVQWLQETKDLVVLDELHNAIELRRDERATRAREIYDWMRQLEARLIVPSFSNDRLLAFLMLGSKRSGESYTTDDVAIFSGLANQAALAIENALFVEELRSTEAYMIQSEKLASLGQMASGMAHEIHNPLTIISGESQLYLERFKGQDERTDTLLHSIIEECQRAADITRRILRFAKPAPPEVSPVDLKVVVEESLTLAGYQVRLDKVEREIRVPEGLPKVRSNQNQLQEVVLNLILNACQAMGEQGGKLMFHATPNGGFVTLTVADTGPGISTANQRKIFAPFFTTKATGTGLGLFVSQRIIKSHGGSIELASEEGKGTCFTIRLQVWKDGPPAGAPAGQG